MEVNGNASTASTSTDTSQQESGLSGRSFNPCVLQNNQSPCNGFSAFTPHATNLNNTSTNSPNLQSQSQVSGIMDTQRPPHCATCICHASLQQQQDDLIKGGYLEKVIMAYTLRRVVDFKLLGKRNSEEIDTIIQEVYSKFKTLKNTPDNKKFLRNKIAKQAANQFFQRNKRKAETSKKVQKRQEAQPKNSVLLSGYNSEEEIICSTPGTPDTVNTSNAASVDTSDEFAELNDGDLSGATNDTITTVSTIGLINTSPNINISESDSYTDRLDDEEICRVTRSPIISLKETPRTPMPSAVLSVYDFSVTPRPPKPPSIRLPRPFKITEENVTPRKMQNVLMSDNNSPDKVLTDRHTYSEGNIVIAQYTNQNIYIAKCTKSCLVYAKAKCGNKKQGINLKDTSLQFNKRDVQRKEDVQNDYLLGVISPSLYHFGLRKESIIPVDFDKFISMLESIQYMPS